jgi:hypothetical protein
MELASPKELREMAVTFDESAEVCASMGFPELEARDRRMAATLRTAATILEARREGGRSGASGLGG